MSASSGGAGAGAVAAAVVERAGQAAAIDRRQQWGVMLAVYGTMALLGLETTATGLVLPQAARELDGLSRYAMMGTLASVAGTISILFAARLGDWIGRKPVWLFSMTLLVIGGAVGGLASSMTQLIIARVLTGVATGMVTAAAVTAPADVFHDAAQRIRWQSFSSVVFAIASSFGPLLGGAVSALCGWRAGFFIVPLGGLLCLGVLARYPCLPASHGARQPMDWTGGLLLMLAIGPPLVALNLAFGSDARPVIAAALAMLAPAALIALVAHERRTIAPFLPLRVLATHESRVLVGSTLVSGATMCTLLFYGPLLLQSVAGATPAEAGVLMTPMLVALPIGSLVNGHLFRRQSRPERLMIVGLAFLVTACCAMLLFAVTPQHDRRVIAIGFALAGLGLGMVQPNQSVFMQMLVEPRDVGVATGLVSTVRSVGNALGAAVTGAAIACTSLASGLNIGIGLLLACSIGVLLLVAAGLDTRSPAFRQSR